MDVENHWNDVRVPALINTASFDIFAVGSIRNFHGMRASGGTAEARAGTKLIMGAYGHPATVGIRRLATTAGMVHSSPPPYNFPSLIAISRE